uniref:Uncharacterized protein n=1 Tax=Rhipicephalus pulchellus TaxID=72859 RepID=L7LVJ9_RHIPC
MGMVKCAKLLLCRGPTAPCSILMPTISATHGPAISPKVEPQKGGELGQLVSWCNRAKNKKKTDDNTTEYKKKRRKTLIGAVCVFVLLFCVLRCLFFFVLLHDEVKLQLAQK